MASNQAVLGLVNNSVQAEVLVDDLRTNGFASKEISALFPDRSGSRGFAREQSTRAPSSAGGPSLVVSDAGDGLAGALSGMGISEAEARQYEGKIRDGNILLAIHAEDDARRDCASKILARHGATDIVAVARQGAPAPLPA